jgi:hypothetical protein
LSGPWRLSLVLCLGRSCGGRRALGGPQLRLGSELKMFHRAHRYHRSRGFSGGGHGGESRLISLARRLIGFCSPNRDNSAGTRLRREQSRMGDGDGRRVAWRHNHAHAQPSYVEQAFGEVVGQSDAAVRRRMSRQKATVESDARPGDAQHVRHVGIVI